MAKRIIRLTESDLRNIIKESVRKILKEEKPDPNAKPWELFKKSKFLKIFKKYLLKKEKTKERI